MSKLTPPANAGDDRLTVKVALVVPASPSVIVTSFSESAGRSSLDIVPRPVASTRLALTAPDRVTVKVSLASGTVSPRIGTDTVAEVWPALNVRVPLVVVKSVPAVAVPAAVA